MSYEEDLEYLRKEFKKSEGKFREAEREGYETDADIWQNDMVNIGHQIHIHERAAKADEYEAKAKAFDRIVKELKMTEFDMYEKELVDERRGLLSFGREISRFLNEYESGESDD